MQQNRKEIHHIIRNSTRHFHKRLSKEVPTSKQIRQRLINEIKAYLLLKNNKSSMFSNLFSSLGFKKGAENFELTEGIVNYAKELDKEIHKIKVRSDLKKIIIFIAKKDRELKERDLENILLHLESYTNIDEKKLVYKLISLLEEFFSHKEKARRKKALEDIERFVDQIVYGDKIEVSHALDTLLRKCYFIYYYPKSKESEKDYGSNKELDFGIEDKVREALTLLRKYKLVLINKE